MSYKNGMAALNLEMSDVVSRTEYSAAEYHIDLINAVLGTTLTPESDKTALHNATLAFRKAWDYGLLWSIDIKANEFGDIRTKMGHAAFAAGNKDFDSKLTSCFKDVDDVFRFDAMGMLPMHTHSELVDRFNTRYAPAAPMLPPYPLLSIFSVGIFCWRVWVRMRMLWDTFLNAIPSGFRSILTRWLTAMLRW